MGGITDIVPRNDALRRIAFALNFVDERDRGDHGLVTRALGGSMEHRLYVGNLEDDVSTDALRRRFEECGVVLNVHLAMDRSSGRMRGYAFVTMATAADARSAIDQLDGAMFEERPLRVKEAGEEREGSHSSKAAADAKQRRARITSQFRERRNMTYELDCAGVPLAIRVFPEDETERAWRIEASTKGTTAGAPATVHTASAPTRARALEEVSRRWSAANASPVGAVALDWPAIVEAMQSVRAI
jgi:RNA recognition motif. (a.k.a. RRM, RBD, or RNP domain)